MLPPCEGLVAGIREQLCDEPPATIVFAILAGNPPPLRSRTLPVAPALSRSSVSLVNATDPAELTYTAAPSPPDPSVLCAKVLSSTCNAPPPANPIPPARRRAGPLLKESGLRNTGGEPFAWIPDPSPAPIV